MRGGLRRLPQAAPPRAIRRAANADGRCACARIGRSRTATVFIRALFRKRESARPYQRNVDTGVSAMPVPAAADVVAAVRKSPGNRVKVAVSDIDGILRG